MKPEVKKLWVEALRSGKYKQGESVLRNGEKFCCLGVLCDVSGLGEWSEGGEYLGEGAELPEEVRVWAHLPSYNPLIGDKRAAVLNDKERKTFEEIADLIEEHL